MFAHSSYSETILQSRSRKAKFKKTDKSKMASHKRRSDESKEMEELTQLLPLPPELKQRLKKSDILRLVVAYIKLSNHIGHKSFVDSLEETCSMFDGSSMLNALNGFLIYLSPTGTILYVSEQVTRHLNRYPDELIGNEITDVLCDKSEFDTYFFGQQSHDNQQSPGSTFQLDENGELVRKRDFTVNMKCHLSKAEKRNGKPQCAVNWCGQLRTSDNEKPGTVTGFVALCQPVCAQTILDIGYTDDKMFICQFNTELKLTLIDPRLQTCLGYECHELLGTNLYMLEHPNDHLSKAACTVNLLTYGRSMSKLYRLKNKNGDWVWIQTHAYTLYDSHKRPISYVTYNIIISNVEGSRYLDEQDASHVPLPSLRPSQNVTSCTSPSLSDTSLTAMSSVSSSNGSDYDSSLPSENDEITDIIIALEGNSYFDDINECFVESSSPNIPLTVEWINVLI